MTQYTKHDDLSQVLYEIFLEAKAINGNFCRYNSISVGALASMGMITTSQGNQTFGSKWRIAETGIIQLRKDKYLGHAKGVTLAAVKPKGK